MQQRRWLGARPKTGTRGTVPSSRNGKRLAHARSEPSSGTFCETTTRKEKAALPMTAVADFDHFSDRFCHKFCPRRLRPRTIDIGREEAHETIGRSSPEPAPAANEGFPIEFSRRSWRMLPRRCRGHPHRCLQRTRSRRQGHFVTLFVVVDRWWVLPSTVFPDRVSPRPRALGVRCVDHRNNRRAAWKTGFCKRD